MESEQLSRRAQPAPTLKLWGLGEGVMAVGP